MLQLLYEIPFLKLNGYNHTMQAVRISMMLWFALVAFPIGCASYNVVPHTLQSQVDEDLTFTRVKESPDNYRGRLVVWGGEVLSAKRLKDATRIEVLQLPLDNQQPVYDRTASQGRFLAYEREFLDPATLPAGTRVTIVGEVTGTATLPLDEAEYTYPTLEMKRLTVWPRMEYRARPYPYMRPYWGPYWGRRGGWYDPYYPYYWW
ncbi:MAG: hypothetical protein C4293_08875 [Nitrospiraceae bacterium]